MHLHPVPCPSQLAVTGFAPTTTTLAGGATLTITGSGFAPTGTTVRVCGDACVVTSVSSTGVTCVAPSSLSHASGRQTLRLVDVTGEEIEPHELGYTPAPPPAPPAAPYPPASPPSALTPPFLPPPSPPPAPPPFTPWCLAYPSPSNGACNSGYQGGSYPGSLDHCFAACKARSGCGFFAWNGHKCAMYTLSGGCGQGFRHQAYTVYKLNCESPPPPPPMPPTPPPAFPDFSHTLSLRRKVVRLAFARLTASNLPSGATLRSAFVTVTPRAGSGVVVAALHASLECGSGVTISNSSSSSSFIEWDMQPYDLGFMTDRTPDLAPLLADAISGRDLSQLQGCSVVLTIRRTQGEGARHFFAPTADLAKRPHLELAYDAPTTAAQLAWVPDRKCNVSVAIPVSITADETCHPVNAAAGLSLAGTSTCPHLQLTATAATTFDSCAMSVNGVDLFAGCGLDRLVVGRDGVCVAQLDGEEVGAPRAACFDTQAAGEGINELASWVENLPVGATAMVVSCSRLAWGHNRERIGLVLARIGALNSPKFLDDAYALVGTKGATAPLSESRTQCCLNPDPVCLTCDQTPAVATVTTACGLHVPTAPSVSVLGTESFFGFGSESHMAAVEALPGSLASPGKASTAVSAADAIATFQTDDADVLDATCETALTTVNGDRYGAKLATDGDASTYWLSSGTRDAVLTIDLGATRRVSHLMLDWKSPAYSLLVLYSVASTGDDWRHAASLIQLAALYADPPGMPNPKVTLSDAGANAAAVGVSARRLRVYMADAPNATHPVFALRELNVLSCAQSELAVTLGSQLAYLRTQTLIVTSIAPRRGSTAGGTLITLQVEGLPSGIEASNVSVTVVGLPCAVASVTGFSISCLTSSYGKTSATNPGNGPVALTLPAVGTAAATANTSYEYIDLWSRYTTWGGEYINGVKNTIPGLETKGDSIWIQRGQRILLDCDIKVYMLIVQGNLEFDRKDIKLDANYIFVMGGSFAVGTEEEPFLQQAIITLHGSPVSKEIPVYGSKTLSCRFCTLDLHGRPVLDGRTHAKLAQTAYRGMNELNLTEPVDWDPLGGKARILVTSSAESGTMEDFDELNLVEVLDGGYRLKVSQPLKYDHLGETRHFANGYTVAFRCEVALLSRNGNKISNRQPLLDTASSPPFCSTSPPLLLATPCSPLLLCRTDRLMFDCALALGSYRARQRHFRARQARRSYHAALPGQGVDCRPFAGRITRGPHRERRSQAHRSDGSHRPLLDPLSHDRRCAQLVRAVQFDTSHVQPRDCNPRRALSTSAEQCRLPDAWPHLLCRGRPRDQKYHHREPCCRHARAFCWLGHRCNARLLLARQWRQLRRQQYRGWLVALRLLVLPGVQGAWRL